MPVVWPQLSVALRYGLSWSYESWNAPTRAVREKGVQPTSSQYRPTDDISTSSTPVA